MRFDLVTVGFAGDLPLLRLQARSISRHLDPLSVGTIIVVDNDGRPAHFADPFARDVLPEYGALRDRVRLVPGPEIIALTDPALKSRGWRRQQALKLDAHRLVTTPAYVTLDCKNHFVRPSGAETFLDPSNRLRVAPRGYNPEQVAPFARLGVPPDSIPGTIFNITTPFPLWTKEVAALDERVRGLTGLTAGGLVAAETDILEYRLYCAGLLARYGHWDGLHVLDDTWYSTYFATEPSAARFFGRLALPSLHVMGVHRRAIAGADAATKASIARHWVAFGLVADAAEGLAILEPPDPTLPAKAGSPPAPPPLPAVPPPASPAVAPEAPAEPPPDPNKPLLRAMELMILLQRIALMGPHAVFQFLHDDHAVRFHLPYAETDLIQRHILTTRSFFEADLLRQIRKWVPRGGVVVDAGANLGNHTIFFGRICGAAGIIAFEPMRETFRILSRNVALNALEGVTLHNVALGAAAGRAVLARFSLSNLGSNKVRYAEEGSYPVIALDSLQLPRVDFVKVDVEGTQLEVLQGARDTLARCRPRVCVEIHDPEGAGAATHAFMREVGYRPGPKVGKYDQVFEPPR